MKVVTRQALEKLFSARLADTELIAPVEIEGKSYFRALEGGLEEMQWLTQTSPSGKTRTSTEPGPTAEGRAASPLTVNSLKEFFFPRRQELYIQRPEGITPVDPAPERPRLVLFARPCETRALAILDRLFLGETRDTSYAAHREATTIVGLRCLEPDEYCFCSSVGGSPFGTEGMDLALTPLDGERFCAEALTEKGEALLSSASLPAGESSEPGQAERELLEALRSKAEAAVSRRLVLPDPEAMEERFDSPYWREVSRACLTCGICSYLCPTCHCFDIVDEGYLRVRCWDTCSAENFTRTAAGENHHRNKHTRYRQRVYHKFSWFKENYGTVACVGCGRCARQCPVKIDIVEVVNGIGRIHGIRAISPSQA